MSLARLLGLPHSGAIVRLEPGDGEGRLQMIRLRDGACIGTLELALRGEDTLVVEALCVDEGARSYGAGSEAARMLATSAAKAGFTTLRAWAPPGLGLAAYFWIRMGLRPRHGEGPDGGIWFERKLA